MRSLSTSAFQFYFRHQTPLSLVSFLAGFGWGVWRARPIDTDWALGLQAFTLLVLLLLLVGELAWRGGAFTPGPRLAAWWRWHELLSHFLLGGLLRGYAVFYLKSAGPFGTWVFFALLALIMFANEMPWVQNRGTLVRTILWAMAFSCFLTYLIPRVTHNLGPVTFTLSLAAAAVLLVLIYALMRRRVPPPLRERFFLWPGLATLAGYLSLYHLALIPPVPLMLARFDVAHQVQRDKREWFLVRHSREAGLFSPEVFWLSPDGDKAVAAFRLVAPPKFVEDLRVRWQWKTAGGWRQTDSIPVQIHGGRREGFRGTTEKSHLWAGDWRVLLETLDGREIGRLRFQVKALDSAISRPLITERF